MMLWKNTGGLQFPRIQDRDPECCEIPDVAGDERQLVLQRRCRDQPIRGVVADAFQLAIPFEKAPSFRNRFCDRQNAAREPRT